MKNHEFLVEHAIAEGFSVAVSRGGPKPILSDSRSTETVLATIDSLQHCELVFHDPRREEKLMWALVDVAGSGNPCLTVMDHDSTDYIPTLLDVHALLFLEEYDALLFLEEYEGI